MAEVLDNGTFFWSFLTEEYIEHHACCHTLLGIWCVRNSFSIIAYWVWNPQV